MLLSAQQGQAFEAPARLSVRKLFRISPLGLSVSFLNGISQGAFYVGLGLFGVAIGLPAGEVGLLVAAGTLGGVLGQFPLGALSDRVDRRLVIAGAAAAGRSEEHTSELQSLMRISYAVFCLKKKKQTIITPHNT